MLPIYGTIIKVVTGFYLGCTGYVIERHNFYVDQFNVKLTCEYEINGKKIQDEINTVLNMSEFETINIPRQIKWENLSLYPKISVSSITYVIVITVV